MADYYPIRENILVPVGWARYRHEPEFESTIISVIAYYHMLVKDPQPHPKKTLRIDLKPKCLLWVNHTEGFYEFLTIKDFWNRGSKLFGWVARGLDLADMEDEDESDSDSDTNEAAPGVEESDSEVDSDDDDDYSDDDGINLEASSYDVEMAKENGGRALIPAQMKQYVHISNNVIIPLKWIKHTSTKNVRDIVVRGIANYHIERAKPITICNECEPLTYVRLHDGKYWFLEPLDFTQLGPYTGKNYRIERRSRLADDGSDCSDTKRIRV